MRRLSDVDAENVALDKSLENRSPAVGVSGNIIENLTCGGTDPRERPERMEAPDRLRPGPEQLGKYTHIFRWSRPDIKGHSGVAQVQRRCRNKHSSRRPQQLAKRSQMRIQA